MIGSGCVTRALCDGQSLASRGRWPIHDRAHPENVQWKKVSKLVVDFARTHGATELLMKLALGQADKCPFDVNSVSELKQQVVETLQRETGFTCPEQARIVWMFRSTSDFSQHSSQPPRIQRWDSETLRVASELAQGFAHRGSLLSTLQNASGVSQSSQTHWITATQEENLHGDGTAPRYKKCPTKLWTYSRRGQVLKFTEPEARARFPNLVVASLGANRKDKPNGTVTARVRQQEDENPRSGTSPDRC